MRIKTQLLNNHITAFKGFDQQILLPFPHDILFSPLGDFDENFKDFAHQGIY